MYAYCESYYSILQLFYYIFLHWFNRSCADIIQHKPKSTVYQTLFIWRKQNPWYNCCQEILHLWSKMRTNNTTWLMFSSSSRRDGVRCSLRSLNIPNSPDHRLSCCFLEKLWTTSSKLKSSVLFFCTWERWSWHV